MHIVRVVDTGEMPKVFFLVVIRHVDIKRNGVNIQMEKVFVE